MKKKITVRQAILNALKSYGALKPKDLIVKADRPANQIYTMVSAMTKEGKLFKTNTGHIVLTKAPALTAIKPEMPAVTEKPAKITRRRATPFEMHLADKASKAGARIEQLERELRDAKIQYFDAMAVIKYLEAKLISVVK